jgi:hypothetical protein
MPNFSHRGCRFFTQIPHGMDECGLENRNSAVILQQPEAGCRLDTDLPIIVTPCLHEAKNRGLSFDLPIDCAASSRTSQLKSRKPASKAPLATSPPTNDRALTAARAALHVSIAAVGRRRPIIARLAPYFERQQWPETYEFPACEPCNGSARLDEQALAVLIRSRLTENRSETDQLDWERLLRGVKNNQPQMIAEWQHITRNETKRVLALQLQRELAPHCPPSRYRRSARRRKRCW